MIITNNEAALRVKCTDSSPEEAGHIIGLLEIELANSANNGRPGVGLAAPQIGIAKNIAIVRLDNENSVNLVNCKYENKYDKIMFRGEGCLSFPGRIENTIRYQEVHIVDNLVYPNRFIATGLFAIVVQHEMDHLNNILLPDIAIPKSRKNGSNDLCVCGSGKKYKRCCKLKGI